MMFLMHKIVHVCIDLIAKENSALEGAHKVTVSTTKTNEQCGEVMSWKPWQIIVFLINGCSLHIPSYPFASSLDVT